MEIYLLRHGEIDHNGEKRFIGHTDVALSDTGRRQALWWRIALADVGFQQIYCSDLVRARQTADILADGTNRWVNVRPAIREINLGQWDGLTAEEVRAGFPGEWEKRGQDIATYRPLRGESFADLAGRVIPAFEQISGQSENRIAVVGHAGVNRVILCHVLGMPIEYVFRLRQDYGALNIIEGSVGSLQVGLMNLKPEWSRARFARHIIEDKSKIT